jgi:hypothetical protein
MPLITNDIFYQWLDSLLSLIFGISEDNYNVYKKKNIAYMICTKYVAILDRSLIMNIDFTYELPSGQEVFIEADVEPGMPALAPSMRGPGEPEEDPTINIFVTYITGDNGPVEIFLDSLWYRKYKSTIMVNILEEIEDKAWETYCDR